jgi:hypothetical protein
MSEQQTVQEKKTKQVITVQGKKKRANEWRGREGDLDVHGTRPLTINYQTSRLTVTVSTRIKPISSDKLVKAMGERVVCRDDQGRRVIYRQTPFYDAWQVWDENTHDLKLEELTPDIMAELLHRSTENISEKTKQLAPMKLNIEAYDGKLYRTIEVDPAVVKRFVRLEDGTEVEYLPPELTSSITVTDVDLRPSVTVDKWLQEGVKAVFAYNLADIPNFWLIVQDLIKNDQVAVVQRWVEKTGGKEKHLILKPHYNVEKAEFELVGLVCLVEFDLPGTMPVPSPETGKSAQQDGQKKRVSLLELTGQQAI